MHWPSLLISQYWAPETTRHTGGAGGGGEAPQHEPQFMQPCATNWSHVSLKSAHVAPLQAFEQPTGGGGGDGGGWQHPVQSHESGGAKTSEQSER